MGRFLKGIILDIHKLPKDKENNHKMGKEVVKG
jgi:hypothetical protein